MPAWKEADIDEERVVRLLFEIDKKDYDPAGKASVRPSARAIIIKKGKIAVIYSQKHKYFKIPGGGIEPGENKIDAMIREVKEEVGLTVIVESVAEFGYVHRIQKGKHEPVFIQDNFYYLCDVTEGQVPPQFTENEKKEEFVPCFVDLDEAIRVNEEYVKENSYDSMIERELRVMKMLADIQET